MAIKTTYTFARANLANLCDEVTANREVVTIHRRGAEDVALISAAELSGLMETAHLLRSPKNAERLLTALARAEGRTVSPQSVGELRREVGLDTMRKIPHQIVYIARLRAWTVQECVDLACAENLERFGNDMNEESKTIEKP